MSVASLITNSSLTLNSAISVSVPDVDVFWYLTPSVINANFPDSPAYSLWDLQFTNWTPTTIANWYYYCPDICDTRAGNVEKTWTPFYDSNDAFAPPSSIPYVKID